MCVFKKIIAVFLLVFLGVSVSGCAAVGFGIGSAISAGEADKLSGIVEVGEIKTKSSANIALLKTAKVSSAVFEKDMVTPNSSPSPNDTKVNTAVMDEVKRSIGTINNAGSSMTIHLKSFFFGGGEIASFYYYGGVTERNTLTYWQKSGVRKAVNTHFVLKQGGNTLLEVHGLWVAGDKGDEVAGARKLAREMVSEVLKKLGSPDSRRATTEAKKEQ